MREPHRRDLDRRLATIAAEQHGAFTRSQVAGLGGTRSIVDQRLSSGRWQQPAPNVFVVSGAPATRRQVLMVAVLASPGAAVSGICAAVLHELAGLDRREPALPQVAVPPGANRRSAVAKVVQRQHFRSTKVDRIPVGTVDQTLLDLAARLRRPEFERVAERALLDRRTHLDRLADQLLVHAGSRLGGLATLRWFVEGHADGGAIPESELERRIVPLLDELGVEYVLQHPVPWDPTGRTRVDVFIPAWNLIVELDGHRWHGSSGQMRRDADRSNLAMVHGIRLLRLTWWHLERPDLVRRLLHACAPTT